MTKERARNGFMRVVLAGCGMTLLGGCTHAAPAVFEAFVMDLLRNAAAALLL